jgi:hypothetical protein
MRNDLGELAALRLLLKSAALPAPPPGLASLNLRSAIPFEAWKKG